MAPSTVAETPWWWRPREAIIVLFLLAALVMAQTIPSGHVWSAKSTAESADGYGDDRESAFATSDRTKNSLEPGGGGEEKSAQTAEEGGSDGGGDGGFGGGDGDEDRVRDAGDGTVVEGGGDGSEVGVEGGVDGGADGGAKPSLLEGSRGDDEGEGGERDRVGEGDAGDGGGDERESLATATLPDTTAAPTTMTTTTTTTTPRQQEQGNRARGGADLPALPPEDPRRGLRIALVANGKSTLKHSFGGDIDGHDLVCRFNFFVTKNFEDKVGTRTDVWFLGQLKMPGPKGFRGTKAVGHSLMNLTVIPEKYIVPIAYEVVKTCTPKKPQFCRPSPKDVATYKKEASFIKRLYMRYKIDPKKVEILPQEYQVWLQRRYKYCHQFPSTGALALVYLMHHFPESKISVYGLDFLKNEIGHYWEKITKHRTIHNMKGEAKLIREFRSTGRVEFKT